MKHTAPPVVEPDDWSGAPLVHAHKQAQQAARPRPVGVHEALETIEKRLVELKSLQSSIFGPPSDVVAGPIVIVPETPSDDIVDLRASSPDDDFERRFQHFESIVTDEREGDWIAWQRRRASAT